MQAEKFRETPGKLVLTKLMVHPHLLGLFACGSGGRQAKALKMHAWCRIQALLSIANVCWNQFLCRTFTICKGKEMGAGPPLSQLTALEAANPYPSGSND